jgi:phenylpropionate dioxygenase-like ring-hydroxylating dioxygenase large terminal subunit
MNTTIAWPEGRLTRVPYALYQEEDVARAEQARIFRGPAWHYLCLETELPAPGSFRTAQVGDMPVVVTRDEAGALHAFENRCAHRGALIVLEDAGQAKQLSCVYHAWTYSLSGELISVAFRRGIRGKGGMPECFDMAAHRPRALRVTSFCGLVFGTLAEATPPIEEVMGPEVTARIRRVLEGRKPVVLGRFTQALPNNWKLYAENVRDSYHASLLHLFFTTFEVNRLTQKGGLIVSGRGGSHVSWSAIEKQAADSSYAAQGIRSDSANYRLKAPELLAGWDEFGDGITLQILSVFPGFVLQQIQNSLAVRQIVPRGVDRTDLNWTYLGFADDTPEQRRARLRQSNLVGPAGFVSMEDGCVGGFVQRGVAAAGELAGVLEMGGESAETTDTRATEASVRGFWKEYRAMMGI